MVRFSRGLRIRRIVSFMNYCRQLDDRLSLVNLHDLARALLSKADADLSIGYASKDFGELVAISK